MFCSLPLMFGGSTIRYDAAEYSHKRYLAQQAAMQAKPK